MFNPSGLYSTDAEVVVTPLQRLVSASKNAMALACESVGRTPLVSRAFERLDERIARGKRQALGRSAWLVSWQRRPDGQWLARLSGPKLARTIERSAWTRTFAIHKTARVVDRIRVFQTTARAYPGLDPDSRRAGTP